MISKNVAKALLSKDWSNANYLIYTTIKVIVFHIMGQNIGLKNSFFPSPKVLVLQVGKTAQVQVLFTPCDYQWFKLLFVHVLISQFYLTLDS